MKNKGYMAINLYTLHSFATEKQKALELLQEAKSWDFYKIGFAIFFFHNILFYMTNGRYSVTYGPLIGIMGKERSHVLSLGCIKTDWYLFCVFPNNHSPFWWREQNWTWVREGLWSNLSSTTNDTQRPAITYCRGPCLLCLKRVLPYSINLNLILL